MEKPKYLSAINKSLYIIIAFLSIIKLILDFTECVYTVAVIFDIIFNFIFVICSITLCFVYKYTLIRFILNYLNFLIAIGALVTSLFSYKYIINDSKLKAIYNFSSYSKLSIVLASFISNVFDEDDDGY